HRKRYLDQDFPGAPGAFQTGHSFPLQLAGHIYAICDRAEGYGDDSVGLPQATIVCTTRDRQSELGPQSARNFGRGLWLIAAHGRHRTFRTTISTKGKVER